MPQIRPSSFYHHRFSCGHSESHFDIFVKDRDILNFSHACARCEPNTAAGQERLKAISNCDKHSMPYVAENGDIDLGLRGRDQYPALLSIREKGGRYVAHVVRQDSAEGKGLQSIYGMSYKCYERWLHGSLPRRD